MNRLIVQIYEIQDPGEAEKLIQLGVDHIGSVIVSEDRWKIPRIRETIRCVADTESRSSLIPLFNDLDIVFRTLDYYRPDIVHFCEALDDPGEDPQALEELMDRQVAVKEKFPEIQIMRSIPIAETGMSHRVPTLQLAEIFQPASDLFLTDTLLLPPSPSTEASQPVQGFVGITGRTCDWHMAEKLVKASQIPVILAGGITPDNVFEGITRVRPSGVDSCTGTNAADARGRPIRFKKDFEKIRRLVEAARRAEKQLNRCE